MAAFFNPNPVSARLTAERSERGRDDEQEEVRNGTLRKRFLRFKACVGGLGLGLGLLSFSFASRLVVPLG
jgi:hypothetical protein